MLELPANCLLKIAGGCTAVYIKKNYLADVQTVCMPNCDGGEGDTDGAGDKGESDGGGGDGDTDGGAATATRKKATARPTARRGG